MIAAMLEFALQATYVQPSANAVDAKASHDSDTAGGLDRGHPKMRVVTHVHADGTVHRHAIGGEKGGIDNHLRKSGSPSWSMAIVAGVLPTPSVCAVKAILIGKLAIRGAEPYRDTEPDGPRRPPRPPSIA
jgi:hypothetical protein